MEFLQPVRQKLATVWLQNGASSRRLQRQPSSWTGALIRQNRTYRLPPRWMNARKRLPEQTSSLGRIRTMRWNSSKSHPNPTQNLGSPEPQTLSARMKKLSREYGWSAMGVYLLLSALDFPFCFAAVRALGVDRISHWEHVVVEGFWKIVEVPFPNARKNKKVVEDAVVDAGVLDPDVREGGVGWGVEAAEKANKSDNASGSRAYIYGKVGILTTDCRYLDSTGTCIRHPQVLHLCPGSVDRCCDAKSGQDIKELGLGYRQAETKSQRQLQEGRLKQGMSLLYNIGTRRGLLTPLSLLPLNLYVMYKQNTPTFEMRVDIMNVPFFYQILAGFSIFTNTPALHPSNCALARLRTEEPSSSEQSVLVHISAKPNQHATAAQLLYSCYEIRQVSFSVKWTATI